MEGAVVMGQTIYMMRHGQTVFNLRGKIQGASDSPLIAQLWTFNTMKVSLNTLMSSIITTVAYKTKIYLTQGIDVLK